MSKEGVTLRPGDSMTIAALFFWQLIETKQWLVGGTIFLIGWAINFFWETYL